MEYAFKEDNTHFLSTLSTKILRINHTKSSQKPFPHKNVSYDNQNVHAAITATGQGREVSSSIHQSKIYHRRQITRQF